MRIGQTGRAVNCEKCHINGCATVCRMQEASISRSASLEAMSNSRGRTTMGIYTGTFLNDTIVPGFISAGVTANPAGTTPSPFSDVIDGGFGRDVLGGGGGSDTFVYDNYLDSLPFFADQITDFDTAFDRINLDPMDANTVSPLTNDDFTSLLNIPGPVDPGFGSPGELHFNQATHVLSGNVDFTPWADFAIQLPFSVGNLSQVDGVDVIF
jgi:hypothetical protein